MAKNAATKYLIYCSVVEFFWVFLTQGYLVFFGIPYLQLYCVPKNLSLWKTLWNSTMLILWKICFLLFCGKIAWWLLLYFHIYWSSYLCAKYFLKFCKNVCAFVHFYVCAYFVFLFSNMSFLPFSGKYAELWEKIKLKILKFSYHSNLY